MDKAQFYCRCVVPQIAEGIKKTESDLPVCKHCGLWHSVEDGSNPIEVFNPAPKKKGKVMNMRQLMRLRERWEKAEVKDESRRSAALKNIDDVIAFHGSRPVRCSLPKKDQRMLGILPPL